MTCRSPICLLFCIVWLFWVNFAPFHEAGHSVTATPVSATSIWRPFFRFFPSLCRCPVLDDDPPREVDRALSAINSTRNQVAADISTARADAEQQITMSARAVEIATNNAQAEVAPLRELAKTLTTIKSEGGSECLRSYLRNLRVPLYQRADRIVQGANQSERNGGSA